MAPSQSTQQQGQLPSMQQAVAVALLLRRRTATAAAAASERCSQLEAEVQQLRAAAAAPPAPPPALPPLVQLVTAAAGASQHPPASLGPSCSPGFDPLAAQLESLQLWHRASEVLLSSADPTLRQALTAAQRYAVLKELAEGPCDGLPALAALERSPVRALLELAGDILHAHAEAEAAASDAAGVPAIGQHSCSAQGREGKRQTQCPPLSQAAHAPLLAAAVAAAVHLCGWQAATGACYAGLQNFCEQALQLACTPPPPMPAHPPGSGPAPPVPTPDQPHLGAAAATTAPHHPALAAGGASWPVTAFPAGAPAIDLAQPSSLAAQQVLAMLHGAPSSGMVLVSCVAPLTRKCMDSLVTSVLGEPLPAQQAGAAGSGGFAASGLGGNAGFLGGTPPDTAAAAAAEEARLLHAFSVLSQQLSAGLRHLAHWVHATRTQDDPFLEELSANVLAARDAAQLISLTHTAAARQMQRLTAQMMAAFQALAS